MSFILCLKWHNRVRCCRRHGFVTDRSDPENCRQRLVDAGIIPVLVELLGSLDTDVQYYSISTLSHIAQDGKNILPSIL